MNDRFINFLGISKKAGKCIEGYNKCEDALKRNRCFLIILSENVSQNTKDKFLRLCDDKKTPVIIGYTSEQLGISLGKDTLSVIGISDQKIAGNLIKIKEQLINENKK